MMNKEYFNLIIVILYMINMLILAKNQSNVHSSKNQLKYAFKMKDFKNSKKILEMDTLKDIKKNNL